MKRKMKKITVKQLIEKLQQLDENKKIFVLYDCEYEMDIDINENEKGEYFIGAW